MSVAGDALVSAGEAGAEISRIIDKIPLPIIDDVAAGITRVASGVIEAAGHAVNDDSIEAQNALIRGAVGGAVAFAPGVEYAEAVGINIQEMAENKAVEMVRGENNQEASNDEAYETQKSTEYKEDMGKEADDKSAEFGLESKEPEIDKWQEMEQGNQDRMMEAQQSQKDKPEQEYSAGFVNAMAGIAASTAMAIEAVGNIMNDIGVSSEGQEASQGQSPSATPQIEKSAEKEAIPDFA